MIGCQMTIDLLMRTVEIAFQLQDINYQRRLGE